MLDRGLQFAAELTRDLNKMLEVKPSCQCPFAHKQISRLNE